MIGSQDKADHGPQDRAGLLLFCEYGKVLAVANQSIAKPRYGIFPGSVPCHNAVGDGGGAWLVIYLITRVEIYYGHCSSTRNGSVEKNPPTRSVRKGQVAQIASFPYL